MNYGRHLIVVQTHEDKQHVLMLALDADVAVVGVTKIMGRTYQSIEDRTYQPVTEHQALWWDEAYTRLDNP